MFTVKEFQCPSNLPPQVFDLMTKQTKNNNNNKQTNKQTGIPKELLHRFEPNPYIKTCLPRGSFRGPGALAPSPPTLRHAYPGVHLGGPGGTRPLTPTLRHAYPGVHLGGQGHSPPHPLEIF